MILHFFAIYDLSPFFHSLSVTIAFSSAHLSEGFSTDDTIRSTSIFSSGESETERELSDFVSHSSL